MPNRDRTGPAGEGPKTGRGMGDCGTSRNVNKRPSGLGRGMGGGMGRGLGRGMGRRKGANGITYFT